MNLMHDETQLIAELPEDAISASGEEFRESLYDENQASIQTPDPSDENTSAKSPDDRPENLGADENVADLKNLMMSIKNFQEELNRNRKDIESHRELLELLGAGAWSRQSQADEESFLKDIREAFVKDPAQATSTIMKKAKEQLWQEFEKRISEEARQKAEFDRFMKGVASDPKKNGLNHFRDEIEYLVRTRGLEPGETVGLIEKIASKINEINQRKNQAINRMRSESQFEASRNSDSNKDPDKEFTKLMSQAKNLDEMFANLRKLNR